MDTRIEISDWSEGYPEGRFLVRLAGLYQWTNLYIGDNFLEAIDTVKRHFLERLEREGKDAQESYTPILLILR